MSTLSSLVGQHFAYASGRTGVLQQILLTVSDRDRLLGAKDLKEAEAILTELKLTNPIDQGLKKADEILLAIGAWMRSEVEMMTPEGKRPVFHVLWLQEDAPVLSYLLKKHHGLTSEIAVQPKSSMTAYNPEDLRALVEDDEVGTLPSQLVTFVRNTKALENPLPQDIDSSVAQYIATVQLKRARTSGSAAIKRYVRHRIDLTNIRTALRLARQQETGVHHLIVGGSITPESLCGDVQRILAAIDRSDLPYDLSNTIAKAADDQNALEQALAKVEADDIAQMWNIPLSIEPVFAFAALTQSQMRLLRVLLIGKRANIGPQDIKRMLPPFISASHYVL